jgi:hypothetical protein
MILLSAIMFALWVTYAFIRTDHLPVELAFLLGRGAFSADIYIYDTYFMLNPELFVGLSGLVIGGFLPIAICGGWWSIATLLATGPWNPRDSARLTAWAVLGVSASLLLFSGLLFLAAIRATERDSSPYSYRTYTFGAIMLDDEQMSALRMTAAGLFGASVSLAVIGLWWSVARIRRPLNSPRGCDPAASEDPPPSPLNHRPSP